KLADFAGHLGRRVVLIDGVDGHRDHYQAIFGVLVMHLDQMRESFFARPSEREPNIDQHNFAAMLEHLLGEAVVLDDTDLRLAALLLGAAGIPAHGTEQPENAQHSEASHSNSLEIHDSEGLQKRPPAIMPVL